MMRSFLYVYDTSLHTCMILIALKCSLIVSYVDDNDRMVDLS